MKERIIWEPIPLIDLLKIFDEIDIKWWIAGGLALDLFINKKTRKHDDIDVLILRKDQLLVQKKLKKWILYKTNSPGLSIWEDNKYLELPINSIWVKKDRNGSYVFEILLLESENDEWYYRRNKRIRGKLIDLKYKTKENIPILNPEIQLLFKGGTNYRKKDFDDLINVFPCLSKNQIEWLKTSLLIQYPKGHKWISYIEDFDNSQRTTTSDNSA